MSNVKPAAWRHRLSTFTGGLSAWILTDTPHGGLWPDGAHMEGFEQEPLYEGELGEQLRRELAEAEAEHRFSLGLVDQAAVKLTDARRHALIEAAEIATNVGKDASTEWPGETWIAESIAAALVAKAEESAP